MRVSLRSVDCIPGALSLVFVVLYCLQIATPFRVNTDSIRLHYMAIGLQEGIGLRGYGETLFPPVFPLVLAGLEQCGLLNSHTIVIINLICLFAGIGLCWKLLAGQCTRRSLQVMAFVTLASWVMIKHVTLALTDIPYLAVSLAALVAIEKLAIHRGHRFWLWLVISAACTACAIGVRTHGIALLPALAWAMVPRVSDRLRGGFTGRNVLAMGGIAAAIAIASVAAFPALVTAGYGRFALGAAAKGGPQDFFVKTLAMRATNIAELTFNVPASLFPPHLVPFLTTLGVLLLGVTAIVVWRRFGQVTSLMVYVVGYLAILAVWPFADARFFIPVLPVLWAVTLNTLLTSTSFGRFATWALIGWFFATGAMAMAFSTRISFSGNAFSDTYSRQLRNSYRAAYDQPRDPMSPPEIPNVVRLVRRYQFGEGMARKPFTHPREGSLTSPKE